MGDGKYLCTFLKNKKMGAPVVWNGSSRGKNGIFRSIQIFLPPFRLETCHTAHLPRRKRRLGNSHFQINPPGGGCEKKFPLGGFFWPFSINTFLKRYISSNVPFIFLKRGAPGGELYLTFKKMAFSYSKGAPVAPDEVPTRYRHDTGIVRQHYLKITRQKPGSS